MTSSQKEKAVLKVALGELELQVSSSGAERLLHAIGDFISPATESMGFVGTWVNGWRQVSAYKAAARAKEICDEAGLRISPLPPKFFCNWLEGASQEDPNSDENITEFWARLLANAVEEHNDLSNLLFATNVLKQLDGNVAIYFDSICSEIDKESLGKQSTFILRTNALYQERLTNPNVPFDITDSSYLFEKFAVGRQKNGVLISRLERAAFEETGKSRVYREKHIDVELSDVEKLLKLETVGLVSRHHKEGSGPRGNFHAVLAGDNQLNTNPHSIYFGYEYFAVTPMGYDFYRRVSQ